MARSLPVENLTTFNNANEVSQWGAPSCSWLQQLPTMASEMVDPIQWPLSPTLHMAVPPELHVLHCVNASYKWQDLLQQPGREHAGYANFVAETQLQQQSCTQIE